MIVYKIDVIVLVYYKAKEMFKILLNDLLLQINISYIKLSSRGNIMIVCKHTHI